MKPSAPPMNTSFTHAHQPAATAGCEPPYLHDDAAQRFAVSGDVEEDFGLGHDVCRRASNGWIEEFSGERTREATGNRKRWPSSEQIYIRPWWAGLSFRQPISYEDADCGTFLS